MMLEIKPNPMLSNFDVRYFKDGVQVSDLLNADTIRYRPYGRAKDFPEWIEIDLSRLVVDEEKYAIAFATLQERITKLEKALLPKKLKPSVKARLESDLKYWQNELKLLPRRKLSKADRAEVQLIIENEIAELQARLQGPVTSKAAQIEAELDKLYRKFSQLEQRYITALEKVVKERTNLRDSELYRAQIELEASEREPLTHAEYIKKVEAEQKRIWSKAEISFSQPVVDVDISKIRSKKYKKIAEEVKEKELKKVQDQLTFKLVKAENKLLKERDKDIYRHVRKLVYEVNDTLPFVLFNNDSGNKDKLSKDLTQLFLDQVQKEYLKIYEQYGNTEYFLRVTHRYDHYAPKSADLRDKEFGGVALARQPIKDVRNIPFLFNILLRQYNKWFNNYLKFANPDTSFEFLGFVLEVTLPKRIYK